MAIVSLGPKARVKTHDDRAGRSGPTQARHELFDEALDAALGVGRPLAQAGMEDLSGGGQGGQDRVVAELLGVAIGGTVLLLAVDLVDGRVDVDDEAFVTRSRPERPRGAEGLADDPLELADVAEGERAQEGPERRRRHHPMREDLGARSSAQHVGVVDVAGPGHHGMHQGQDLAPRPEAADASGQLDRGVTELLEPEPAWPRWRSSTSPALATRFGSSKVTATRSIPRDTGFTESASFVGENYGVSNRNSPSNGGIFRGCARVRSRGYAVDRG